VCPYPWGWARLRKVSHSRGIETRDYGYNRRAPRQGFAGDRFSVNPYPEAASEKTWKGGHSKVNKSEEFKRFDETMGTLLKVPHSEIKAKLDAEKAGKQKQKRKPKTSALDRASRAKD